MNRSPWLKLFGGLALLLGSLVFSPVTQAESSVVIGGYWNHLQMNHYYDNGERKQLNESGLAVGIEYDNVRAVWYENSYYKKSLGVMWVTPKYPVVSVVSVNGILGGTTGYEHTPEHLLIAPVIGIEANVNLRGYHLVFGYHPVAQFVSFHTQIDF